MAERTRRDLREKSIVFVEGREVEGEGGREGERTGLFKRGSID